jgi:hypothetical protein
MTRPQQTTWLGWLIDRPGGYPYVQANGTEAEAWEIALGWPSPAEIEHHKRNGARALRVQITVIAEPADKAGR